MRELHIYVCFNRLDSLHSSNKNTFVSSTWAKRIWYKGLNVTFCHFFQIYIVSHKYNLRYYIISIMTQKFCGLNIHIGLLSSNIYDSSFIQSSYFYPFDPSEIKPNLKQPSITSRVGTHTYSKHVK